jgi:hypothetical protein
MPDDFSSVLPVHNYTGKVPVLSSSAAFRGSRADQYIEVRDDYVLNNENEEDMQPHSHLLHFFVSSQLSSTKSFPIYIYEMYINIINIP